MQLPLSPPPLIPACGKPAEMGQTRAGALLLAAVLAASHLFLCAVCYEDAAEGGTLPDRTVWTNGDYEYEEPLSRLSTEAPDITDGVGKFKDEMKYGSKMNVAIKFLPDGRLLGMEKRGTIKIYNPNDPTATDGAPYLDIGRDHAEGVNPNAERGLLGLGERARTPSPCPPPPPSLSVHL